MKAKVAKLDTADARELIIERSRNAFSAAIMEAEGMNTRDANGMTPLMLAVAVLLRRSGHGRGGTRSAF